VSDTGASEITPSTGRLKRYTSLASAFDLLTERRLTLLTPSKWQDTNDTAFIEAYRRHRKLGSVLAACFTQTKETYHHWQVFASQAEGVCIELDRTRLLSSLPQKGPYLWGEVTYMTLNKMRQMRYVDVYDLPFIKRYGYRDEKEFRLLYDGTEVDLACHHIPLRPDWVKRIVLNPWMHQNLKPAIQAALKRVPGFDRLSVVQSSLINNAQWKRACDRLDEFSELLGAKPNKI
jgi:hypothetical protein